MKLPILPALLLCTLASAPVLQAQVAAQLWENRYNGTGNNNDYAYAVAVDGSGNVIVTGLSNEAGSGTNAYTAKYEAVDGALLWEKRQTSAITQAVAVDADGNVLIVGYSLVSNQTCCTAKYAAADGALVWENTGLSAKFSAIAVAVDGGGNVCVTGISTATGQIGPDYYTVKYAAANGAPLWEKRYNGPGNKPDYALAIAVDGNDNVIVTGYSPSSGVNDDYYTAKYAAADGTLLWEKRYNGPGNSYDQAAALAVDGSGNVIVTGYSTAPISGSDYYTAKYAGADGSLLWEKRYNGTGNKDDRAQAVAVDGNDNVVVTGYSTGAFFQGIGSARDYYTAKYAAANGALLWEKRYNGPDSRDDEARALALDVNGNVIVTGFSRNNVSNQAYGDYYTVKYAGATGAQLWEKRYNGPASQEDVARAVAVDGSGNVIVTGYSPGTLNNTDFYTAKYSPLTLLDYAFGLDPANGSSQLPQWEVSNGTISTTFTQPPGIVSGTTYGAEWTTDLAAHPWTPIPDTGTGGAHTFSVPIGPEPRKFFRFTVSQPRPIPPQAGEISPKP